TDGTTIYQLNKENLFKTIFKCAKREAQEELGINIEDYGLNYENLKNRIIFFKIDNETEVNKVHVACVLFAYLNKEDFNKLLNIKSYNKDEIESINSISINFKNIVEDFNLFLSLNIIKKQLKENYNLEDWSITSIFILIETYYKNLFANIKFEDIVKLFNEKTKNN
ncbi:MAG: hypothetical protein ACK4UJ_12620, partial [Leptonema sp. (in: bacteria)]